MVSFVVLRRREYVSDISVLFWDSRPSNYSLMLFSLRFRVSEFLQDLLWVDSLDMLAELSWTDLTDRCELLCRLIVWCMWTWNFVFAHICLCELFRYRLRLHFCLPRFRRHILHIPVILSLLRTLYAVSRTFDILVLILECSGQHICTSHRGSSQTVCRPWSISSCVCENTAILSQRHKQLLTCLHFSHSFDYL